MGNRKENLGAD